MSCNQQLKSEKDEGSSGFKIYVASTMTQAPI